MMKILAVLTAVSLVAASATAQEVDGDMVCEHTVPQMLQFISVVGDLTEKFREVNAGLPNADQVRFSGALQANTDLETAARAYRSEFLKACYGS